MPLNPLGTLISLGQKRKTSPVFTHVWLILRSKTPWATHGNSRTSFLWLYSELSSSWTSFLVFSAGELVVQPNWKFGQYNVYPNFLSSMFQILLYNIVVRVHNLNTNFTFSIYWICKLKVMVCILRHLELKGF